MPETMSADPFSELLGREIFETDGRCYLLHHVLSAAAYQGRVQGFLDEYQDKLACGLYAEEEGFEIDDAEIQLSYDTFRYEQGIFTAEETLAWLSERNLGEADIAGFLERNHWHARFMSLCNEIRETYVPPKSAFAASLWPELVLTGFLETCSIPLAWRVLASQDVSPDRELLDKLRGGPNGWHIPSVGYIDPRLEQLACPGQWINELIEMEACFMTVCEAVLSPERCMKLLQTRSKLDYMRFVLQVAVFTSLDAAREAYQCVVLDGDGFEKTMARVGVQMEERRLLLEDAHETLRLLLISAVQGDVLLTTVEGGDSVMYRIVEKTEPGLEDPDVRERIESFLLSQHFEPLVPQRIRWLVPLE